MGPYAIMHDCSSLCLRPLSPPPGGVNDKVRDAWPVRHQTNGYLPSFGASPPLNYSTKLHYLVTEAGVREWLAKDRTSQCSG